MNGEGFLEEVASKLRGIFQVVRFGFQMLQSCAETEGGLMSHLLVLGLELGAEGVTLLCVQGVLEYLHNRE